VDLFSCSRRPSIPHGSTEREFDSLFTTTSRSSSTSTAIRG
jgi:hypothetical protein